ncbi:unnamed protein product [Urochloa humidicola]
MGSRPGDGAAVHALASFARPSTIPPPPSAPRTPHHRARLDVPPELPHRRLTPTCNEVPPVAHESTTSRRPPIRVTVAIRF